MSRAYTLIAFLTILTLARAIDVPQYEDGKVVRGQRYCELLQPQINGLFGIFSEIKLDVWSTFLLNECPQQAWDALSLPFNTIRNGPRYWLMDRIKAGGKTEQNVRQAELRDWGGLELFKLATVSFSSVFELLGKMIQRHFSVTRVERDTQFIWAADSRVYVLFNGTHSWVMQSYFAGEQSDMGSKLSALGAVYRKMPAGWLYETCVLSAELRVGASGVAHVIQDELYNTFQLYDLPTRICSSALSSAPPSHRDEL